MENTPYLLKTPSPGKNWGGWISAALLSSGILAVFITRTALARTGSPPRLFEILNTLTLVLASLVLVTGFRRLQRLDWPIALGVAALLGGLLSFSTFYPFFSLKHPILTSLAHAGSLAIIFLAGLVIMRQGGPVQVKVVDGNWAGALKSASAGILFGLPLAALNAFAFSVMEARPLAWQNPALAGINALQPGIVEEIVYRLAFLGFIWHLLCKVWPDKAVPLAAALSLIVHNYAHFDQLLLDQPLFALGYGAAVGLLFGLPMTYLAVRRDLETAIGFHWIIDLLRFAVGF